MGYISHFHVKWTSYRLFDRFISREPSGCIYVINYIVRRNVKSNGTQICFKESLELLDSHPETFMMRCCCSSSGSHTENFMIICGSYSNVSSTYFNEVEEMLHILQEFIAYSCIYLN